MKCPKCNGRGTVGYFHIDHFVDIECDRCNGSGEVSEVEMTNEEHLKSCTTEQLAEWIADTINDTVYSMSIDAWAGDVDRDEYWQRKSEWVEWLKQPHKRE